MAQLPELTDRNATPAEERSTRGLLARMREGDTVATDALFAQHGSRLAKAIRAKLPPARRRLVDVDDLVQETFHKSLSHLEHFEWRGQGAFLAWLLQIALHTLEDEARRAMRRPPMLSLSAGAAGNESAPDLQPPDAGGTPSEHLARAEEQSLLERALDQLDEDDRDLVIRRAYFGQDYASLAQEMHIAEGAVRMRMHRALSAMSRWAHQHG